MKNVYMIGLTSFVCILLIWNFFSASSALTVLTGENKNTSQIRLLDNEGNQVATYELEKDNPFKNNEAMKQATNEMTSWEQNNQGRKGTIEVPKGTWRFDEQILLPEGAILKGENEKTVLVRTLDAFPKGPVETIDGKKYYEGIIRMNSHTTMKNIILDGKKGNRKANPSQNGIVARGKYAEGGEGNPPHESDYLEDIIIEDTVIQNITGDGITLDLIRGLTIKGSIAVKDEKCPMQVKNTGNNGIMGYSIENATIKNVLTKKIGDVNDGGKNYNIALTMQKMNEPPNDGYELQTKYPVSKNVSVTNSVFIDNSNWEGLDTHSGQNMEFTENVFVGIARPIVIGGQEYNRKYYYPPKGITIKNNRINQGKDVEIWKPRNGKQSKVGIAVWGATQNYPLVENGKLVGSGDERYQKNIGYITGTKIMNNTIDQVELVEKQKKDASMFGGIALKLTKEIIVEGNQIGLAKDGSMKGSGIILSSSNIESKIQNNQVGHTTGF
ncbi:hypothetical protein CON22_25990 [Bacillus cereus]|nr:hypothetical protein CON22_25990 [Bacillus cereus]